MEAQIKKFDVAISFLYEDVNLAKALYDRLSEGLDVFFFPRNQEELAGTDGLESMREPFRNQSLLNVVLYRPRWGHTPWTAVEEVAVKDSCLHTAFKSLFFLVIEPTADLPKWLPETHVRFNSNDFSLEQAVGAIKARVQERGGQFVPPSPARRAELLKSEDDYRRDRSSLLSEAGALKTVEALFKEITRQCDEISQVGHYQIQHAVNFKFRQVEQSCVFGLGYVSISVVWHQPYGGTLHKASLICREFDQLVILPPGHMYFANPNVISQKEYGLDVSRIREYGWTLNSKPETYVSSTDLAKQLVIKLLDLVERDNAGNLVRRKHGRPNVSTSSWS